MTKNNRRVWRQSDQPPRHHRQVDLSERTPEGAAKVGAPLEARPGVTPRLLQSYVDATEHMQTPEFWRSVWKDA